MMTLASTRMPLESISTPGPIAEGGSKVCPACGGILRVESYTSQRPGQEPEVRAVGICTGQGVTRKADGVRWRPRAGCGRFVL